MSTYVCKIQCLNLEILGEGLNVSAHWPIRGGLSGQLLCSQVFFKAKRLQGSLSGRPHAQ